MNNLTSLFSTFSPSLQERVNTLFSTYHFSKNEELEIIRTLADLRMWDSLSTLSDIDAEKIKKASSGQQGKLYLRALREEVQKLTKEPTYDEFYPHYERCKKEIITRPSPSTLFGKCPCPVDGEKTRCCKLTTLDAILGCPFGCAYCSIASFYDKSAIVVPNDLDKRLSELKIDDSIWHIGTGQSSDSLVFGDDHNTLTALSNFASKHPNLVLEFKTKSSRTDFLNKELAKNILFTWSLNARTIIEKEEHFTAKLEERIKAAKKVAEHGYKVGFHIHPIVHFEGWEKEYKEVVDLITSNIRPKDICTISMGTLTFTKANLQRLREEGKPTKVLQLPLTLTAGKYSYPLSVKQEFFSTIYNYFPKEYKKGVFFYLCMEDPSLWLPVFGREYSSDKEFELDMKANYYKKLGLV